MCGCSCSLFYLGIKVVTPHCGAGHREVSANCLGLGNQPSTPIVLTPEPDMWFFILSLEFSIPFPKAVLLFGAILLTFFL
jgi:hypothetical protein